MNEVIGKDEVDTLNKNENCFKVFYFAVAVSLSDLLMNWRKEGEDSIIEEPKWWSSVIKIIRSVKR